MILSQFHHLIHLNVILIHKLHYTRRDVAVNTGTCGLQQSPGDCNSTLKWKPHSSAAVTNNDHAACSLMWSPKVQFGFACNVIEKIILK